jgi:glycosyltransferase involved in cell wall biosynthesis
VIRILFVSHTLDFRAGGAERVLCDVLQLRDRSGYEAVLAVPRSPEDPPEEFRALGLETHLLPRLQLHPTRRPSAMLQTAWELLRLNVALLRLLRRERFDVMHVNSVFALHFAVLPARIMRCPLVYHEHGLPRSRSTSVWSWMFPWLLRRASHVISITDAVAAQVMEFRVDPSEMTTVHNGIDLAAPESGARVDHWRVDQAKGGRAPFTFVKVANLHEWKGHETVVRALPLLRRELPEAKVVFLGRPVNPAFHSYLRSLVDELGAAGMVEFGGFRSNVNALLPAFDCLVLASRAEPFGLVLLEAMRAGVPVVASNAGGVPEIIRHEQNGLLFEPDDAQGLAAQLLRIAKDDALRERLVERGQASVHEQFSLEAQVQGIETVLREAARNDAGSS